MLPQLWEAAKQKILVSKSPSFDNIKQNVGHYAQIFLLRLLKKLDKTLKSEKKRDSTVKRHTCRKREFQAIR